MSHNKGFHFLDVYWAFNEKPHLFKDGLHLNGEGAGKLGTSVRIATQVHFWTKGPNPPCQEIGKASNLEREPHK